MLPRTQVWEGGTCGQRSSPLPLAGEGASSGGAVGAAPGARECGGNEVSYKKTRAFIQKKLGQTYLVCTARNFFPRDIKVSWVRNGEVADHGSDTTDIVPQIDGTFQVRSVHPLNGDSRAYACQVEHEAIGEKLLIPLEHNVPVANEALIIIGAVLGILGICAMVVTAILYFCLLKGSTKLGLHPTVKFNNQAGLCRMSTCTASVRSTESNTSNSSDSSADGLTKSST
ncbi:H-2 class I histocompatibility antigen, D-P alpha chain-like [Pristis pectinata]|uniref:H-2 class I histocompatibility antigen, D-P alpha chain-like n=1 Tax=Pristis pectinata TaxID=685728 RepID=UPI00223E0B96|nr:H-2 class I histocompatibility antigen, D-P alpha chain-like [Pristis pectinata]